MIKTLVRMKSTQMGKDDDGWMTVQYNEGCETRIGPDLLKAFQAKNAVEILKEKKQEPSKPKSDPTPNPSSEKSDNKDSGDTDKGPKGEDADQSPEKQKGRQKKNK